MKVQTTAKQIRMYGTPICFGYGDLQHILRDDNPQYYTAGIYGWNADIYDFGSFQIVTGYRPFGMDAHAIPYREMDKAAYDSKKRAEVRADFLELCRQLAFEEKPDEKITAKYIKK